MKKIALFLLLAYNGGIAAMAQDNKKADFDALQDSVVSLPYSKLNKQRSVGAVSTVKGEDLLRSTRPGVNTAISGLASGLFVLGGSSNPGSEIATWKIRGLSRGNDGDGPLIVIDGQNNRSLNSITIDEIETVEVLKDITAKMLYGSKAANGVIMITTKRGKGKIKYNATAEYGWKHTTRLPKYIGSADYTRLYNEALSNDGIEPIYTPDDLAGYKNHTNNILYPDVDFYKTFMNDNTQYAKGNLQVSGTKDNTSFFVNLGYYGEDGLEAVGKGTRYDRFNLRSNLDYKVNDYVSAYLDIAARWDLTSRPNMSYSDYFNAMTTHRPNDYPLFVKDYGDTNYLGWGVNKDSNLYGDLTRKGYADDENSFAQTNIGLNFNLSPILSGLTGKVFMSYDAYNAISKGKNYSYSRVRVEEDGSFTRIGVDNVSGAESKFSDNMYKNFGLTGQLNYQRQFGDHSVLANLVYNLQDKSLKKVLNGPSTVQDDKSMNVGFRLNYSYADKYIAEVDASLMGSDKFTKDNRWGLFESAGLAWNINKEGFMQDVDWVNNLKLKGSFGVMGYDNAFNYLTYENYYTAYGNLMTGIKNSGPQEFGFKESQVANPDLTFEKSRELNIGIEAGLFNNRLNLDANYFNEYRYDIPTYSKFTVPGYVGLNQVYPYINYNEISNRGFEAAISWSDKIGDLKYTIGGNFTYAKSMIKKYDENNLYSFQNRSGHASDAIMGWIADGLYKNDQQILDDGLGSKYGTVMPGDIKFINITNDKNDNIIDDYDKTYIGNSFPRFTYSLNVSLEYKGLSLYLLGNGVGGFDRMMTNSYYFCTGNAKYSEKVLGAAHYDKETGSIQDDASYPRLTTKTTSHSYRASTYWMEKGDYFKLRSAELAYTLPKDFVAKAGVDKFRLFLKGDNLFTLSSIKDLDPENINAGITGNPMFRTFSAGFNLTF